MAPLAFICANLIIYWTDWEAVSKLELGILAGFVLFGLSYAFKHPVEKPPLDPIALAWMVPWLGGLALISFLGQYGGIGVLPDWIDLLVVAGFSLVIFYIGVRVALPRDRVHAAFAEDEAEAAADPILAEG